MNVGSRPIRRTVRKVAPEVHSRPSRTTRRCPWPTKQQRLLRLQVGLTMISGVDVGIERDHVVFRSRDRFLTDRESCLCRICRRFRRGRGGHRNTHLGLVCSHVRFIGYCRSGHRRRTSHDHRQSHCDRSDRDPRPDPAVIDFFVYFSPPLHTFRSIPQACDYGEPSHPCVTPKNATRE